MNAVNLSMIKRGRVGVGDLDTYEQVLVQCRAYSRYAKSTGRMNERSYPSMSCSHLGENLRGRMIVTIKITRFTYVEMKTRLSKVTLINDGEAKLSICRFLEEVHILNSIRRNKQDILPSVTASMDHTIRSVAMHYYIHRVITSII